MARYLTNAAFVIVAGIQTGLLATGNRLSHWDQIAWTCMAGAWAILAAIWKARADG